MHPTIFFVLLATLPMETFAYVLCGQQEIQPLIRFGRKLTRIIGGNTARQNSWPWQVLLETAKKGPECGASLVPVNDDAENSDIVVTAAHCLYDEIESGGVKRKVPYTVDSMITARLGAHYLDKDVPGQKRRRISKILVYPSYNATEGDRNDIALLKLALPVQYSSTIHPVCLPEENEALPVGRPCAATGWGRNDSYSAVMSNVLKELPIEVHSAGTCRDNEIAGYGSSYVEDEMICAGSIEGRSATCNGDSGGPLVCKDGFMYTLYGATSFGMSIRCVNSGYPPVFTRVSHYAKWIKDESKKMTSLKRLFNFADVFGKA